MYFFSLQLFTIVYKMLCTLTLARFYVFGNGNFAEIMLKLADFAMIPIFSCKNKSKIHGIVQLILVILVDGQVSFGNLYIGVVVYIHDQCARRALLPCVVAERFPQGMTADIPVNMVLHSHIFYYMVSTVSGYVGKVVIFSTKNIFFTACRCVVFQKLQRLYTASVDCDHTAFLRLLLGNLQMPLIVVPCIVIYTIPF